MKMYLSGEIDVEEVELQKVEDKDVDECHDHEEDTDEEGSEEGSSGTNDGTSDDESGDDEVQIHSKNKLMEVMSPPEQSVDKVEYYNDSITEEDM